jgi:predicted HicB family RNase H-like nuclease
MSEQQIKKFTIRMDAELLLKIKIDAAKKDITMNALLIDIIKAHYENA